MATGVIKRLNDEKGFGFIAPDQREAKGDIFFHASDVEDPRFNDLNEGDKVSFEETQGDRGPRAKGVRRL